MKLPAQLKFMIKTIMAETGRKLPPGVDLIFDTEWGMPQHASPAHFAAAGRSTDRNDVLSVVVAGLLPTGGNIEILIKVEGLREIPLELKEFAGSSYGSPA